MGSTSNRPDRLDAVDFLRGAIIIIMALDHVRDFWGAPSPLDPSQNVLDATNLETTWPALFFTRWITHYCAPNFIFLAGVGAFLSGTRGQTKGQVAWLLFSRGLWLAVFEITIVQAGWKFNWDVMHHYPGVFWAIGWSMVILSFLIFLPTWLIGALGVALIALHNLTDGVKPEDLDWFGGWWQILHGQGKATELPINLPLRDWNLFPYFGSKPEEGPIVIGTGYKIIPWCGVMAAGYAFGELLRLPRETRRPWLLIMGGLITLSFFVLRATNLYGDPFPWALQRNESMTVVSFLNCHKYPPSLCYLLMTLGPAIFILGWFDYPLGAWAKPIITFGRVPMFFYLLHIPLIHGGIVALDYIRYGWSPALTSMIDTRAPGFPSDYGINLTWCYVVWVIVIFILYWPCAWFAGVKKRRRDWWLKYI
jgi:uncharacterized membrane protein